MNIVEVVTRADAIGGAQLHVRDVAKGLLAAGHQVTVCVGGKGPFLDELGRHAIPARSLGYMAQPIHPWRDVRAVSELYSLFRELRPDLVALHSSKAGFVGRVAARMVGIPAVFTAHGWAFTEGVPPGRRRLYGTLERMMAPWVARIITVSEYDLQLALRNRVASREKVVAIHNGIPDVGLAAHPEEQGEVRVVMVARFEPQKDQALALRALARVTQKLRLILVGDGPGLADTQALARSLGLADRVEFLGARSDVPHILAGAHIFLLASRWEGFPLSILEAMRAGLPVVASDVGGVREAVAHEETGALVARGDEEGIARYLDRLAADPYLRGRWGSAGRHRYAELFTFERMMAQTLEIYQEAAIPLPGR